MARCDNCLANKVCDHNKHGFENCGNYIPAEEAKAEVARGIFEEIEKTLKAWRVELIGNEFYHRSLVDKSIAELKKKYTEGE